MIGDYKGYVATYSEGLRLEFKILVAMETDLFAKMHPKTFFF